MAIERTCATCGHVNTGDALFCSKCGARLPDPVRAPAPEPPGKLVEAAAVPVAPPRRVAGAARTMLGRPADPVEPEPPPEADDPVPPPEAPAKRIPGSARTMLGMPAPDAARIQAAVAEAKRNIAAKESPADRMTDPDEPGAPVKRAPIGPSHRTMIGQPAPRPDQLPPPDDADPTEAASDTAPDPVPSTPSFTDSEEFVLPTRKTGRGILIALVAMGAVALIGAVAVGAWMFLGRGPVLHAVVVQGDEGEMLQIEVPGAAAGTRVRFHGTEQPLVAGRARLPLAADALSLGDNQLSVDVVGADGSARTVPVELHLELRVRADLAALNATPPAVEVHVEAPPGSHVTLDGQPLTLDARGHGVRNYPIDPTAADAEGVVRRVVHYVVQPPAGAPAQGDLHTRIPLTTMQIDRPGADVVTDRDSVEVAGAVAPGATVTIDGHPATVAAGRFVQRMPLTAVGERTIEVIARAPGKAPHVERIHIRRVADLEAEAAAFTTDPAMTYAHIVTNPNLYRGQRVSFQGMVYNVDVRGGRSVLQMLVDQCPQGERCSLWVTYPAATDAEVRSRVRVLGTVAGEQQFRSQSGQVRTVPRVDAVFVLPERRGR